VAPDVALGEFATMNQLITRSIGDQIFAARLLGFFALAALAIALAGLYGLLAFAVAHRTREMGIRMALGAERHDIVAMVLGQAAVLLAIGITLGGGLAWASARWLSAYLYGVKPHDPLTLAAAAVLLALAGLWAAYGPARRAGNVSPAIALTAE
ncbi:MAG TPA: FtsX-like permease family protein, partial [Terriglobales bacterium]|nr:FtsX-like permease family protein [Terriglobales bacterium]